MRGMLGYGGVVRFGVLGILYAETDSDTLGLGGPVQRRLLAALLARAPSVVSAETLIDDLWGDSAPASAGGTLQSHVARLRAALGRDGWPGIETVGGGYRLPLERRDLDAWVFADQVAAARREIDSEAVARGLRAALSLWRGPAYAEFAGAGFADAETARLEALRDSALDDRVEADLSAGWGAELVPELETLVVEHPFRERLWAALVVALYRAGRQADALGAYQRARALLGEELGVEPGPGLREAERRVLAQDPTLLAARVSATVTCPWKGLASYDTADAGFFAGRERLVSELVARLVDNAVVVVTGVSGSGKSSVVRAGLLPALAAGGVIGSAAWRCRVIVPGPDAAASVAAALDGKPDLVVVDQAEELFTLNDSATTEWAAAELRAAVDRGVRLVLVLRGELFGQLADLPGLAHSIGTGTVLVGLPDPDDLRRMLQKPAGQAGLSVEAALVDAVLADVAGRPGALPLMSTALVRTWERRDGHTLTLAGYLAGGGVATALERLAEEAYGSLDGTAQQAARRALMRLAVNEDGTWTRRRVRLEELAPPGDAAARSALDALTDRRLVTVGRGDAQVSHEALFVAWPRLAAWLDDRSISSAVIEHLARSASAWDAGGRESGDLYRGARLQSALDVAATHPEELGPVELDFVEAGQVESERELGQERMRTAQLVKGRRRLRLVTGGLVVGLLLTAGSGGVAVQQAREARNAALVADSRRLGAEALTQEDGSLSLLLAVTGVRLDDTVGAEGNLLTTLLRASTPASSVTLDAAVRGTAVSSDGWIALSQADNSIWVAPTADALANASMTYNFQFDGDVAAVHWMPGHSRLLFGGTSPPRIYYWNPNSDPLGGGAALEVSGWDPDNFAVTSDGTWLVGLPPKPTVGSRPWEMFVHDLRGSTADQHIPLHGAPRALAVTGRTAVVMESSGAIEVVDVSGASHSGSSRFTGTGALAVSPNGRLLAVDGTGTVVNLFDLVTGTRTEVLTGLQSPARVLAFSPDGGRLAAAAGANEPLQVWDVATGAAPRQFPPEDGPVSWLAWSSGGSQLLTATADRPQLLAWSAATPAGVTRLILRRGPTGAGQAVVASVDVAARRLAVGTDSGEVWFLDLDTGHVWASPRRLDALRGIESIQFAEHGALALTADSSGVLTLWDVATATPLSELTSPLPLDVFPTMTTSVTPQAAVSPDGHTAASYPNGYTLQILDLHRRTRLHQYLSAPALIQNQVLGWSADGRSVIVQAVDTNHSNFYSYALVDVSTGHQRWRTQAIYKYAQQAVDLDQGRTVAVGDWGGVLRFFDASTGHPEGSVGAEITPVTTLSVSPDGRRFASGGLRGSVRLWDAATRQQVGSALPFPVGNLVATAALSNREVVAVGTDGAVLAYDVDPSHWTELACTEAGRTLTQAEWQRFLPGRPYHDPCQGSTGPRTSSSRSS